VDAVESCADESGWAPLAAVGKVVSNHVPDFDPRHYGFKKLSSLIEATGLFEIKRQTGEDASAVFVRHRPDSTVANSENAAKTRMQSDHNHDMTKVATREAQP
jgi:hypothetical protein